MSAAQYPLNRNLALVHIVAILLCNCPRNKVQLFLGIVSQNIFQLFYIVIRKQPKDITTLSIYLVQGHCMYHVLKTDTLLKPSYGLHDYPISTSAQ